MTKSKRAAFLIISLLVIAYTLLGLIETGFVLYDLPSETLSRKNHEDLGVGIRSWTVHHAMRPGYQGPGNLGEDQEIQTNSFGLRGPEPAVPKPHDVFRILFLGDSFTYGWNVKPKDRFSEKLQSRLEAPTGKRFETVNAGLISYCPLLSYLQYKHHLHILEPDLLVLSFDMSDLQDHQDYKIRTTFDEVGRPLFCQEPTLGQPRGSAPDLLFFRWMGIGHANTAYIEGHGRYDWTRDGESKDWTSEAREALMPAKHLADLLNTQNIPFALATYPQPWQADRQATPWLREWLGVGENTIHTEDKPFHMIEAFAKQQGIAHFNVTPSFRNHPDTSSLYFQDDIHFTPKGHALYAANLAKFLLETFGRELKGTGSSP